MRMTFNIFDFSEDNNVCMLDLFALMKMYENEDEIFVKAYSHDICRIVSAIHSKQKSKGKEDFEFKQRLRNIEKKVEQITKLKKKHQMPSSLRGSLE